MRQVIFRKQARLEFDEAGDWYEKERTGLGMEFLAEIQSLIQRISSTPEQFSMLLRDASPIASTSGNVTKESSYLPYSTVRAIRQCGRNEGNEYRGQFRNEQNMSALSDCQNQFVSGTFHSH